MFLPADLTLRWPAAHGEGRLIARDAALQQMLCDEGYAALRYVDESGAPTEEYPANPNGSLGNIAGVYNESKTILGLMPHPERLSDPGLGGTDGAAMFDGLVEALS